MAESEWRTRRLEPGDRAEWERLFGGYCRFYEVEPTAEHLETVWSWIFEQGAVEAIVAVRADGEGAPVGLAHVRPFVRPVRGELGGYLDDLFVEEAARGTGVFEALFAALEQLAAERGWSTLRWITAADNHRARAAYERLAVRTEWVTYEVPDPGRPPA
jgi:GNAT superfamily N-acetyltransferase